jgi:hypothetical protein
MGDQLNRAHLVKADHHPIIVFGSVEREHALGLLGEVGVRAPLPRARALMREAGANQRLAQRLLAELDAQAGQVQPQLGQRPTRQRDALMVGAGARDRHNPVALLGRRLAWAPAPVVRVQRVKPWIVERVDHLAHVRLIGAHQPGYLRRRHPGRGRQQDHRPLTLGLIRGALGDRLQPRALLRSQLAHEHLRRTHRHLAPVSQDSTDATKTHDRMLLARPRGGRYAVIVVEWTRAAHGARLRRPAS